MFRKTYAEINLSNVLANTQKLITYLKDYNYHIGVVKADCYGHDGIKVVKKIINGGCNYLAVATLEEALAIRKYYRTFPILCLGVISNEDLKVCIKNQVTISITSLNYLKSLNYKLLKKLRVHLKINTGMNRLGISSEDELNEVIKILNDNAIHIEGIYTHIYNDSNQKDTVNQIEKFEKITKGLDLSKIPIIHFGASGYTLKYPKLPYVNGCRLGIAFYGLISNELELKSTFSLYSNVIQINEVNGGTVGYNGSYKVQENERIAVVPIGYADGIIRQNTGRNVYINNQKYPIVGNVCMDMLFVRVDNNVNVGDVVVIIKDNEHVMEIANHLKTISYEVICSIGKRIQRIYK